MPFSARGGFFSSAGGEPPAPLTREEILTEIATWTSLATPTFTSNSVSGMFDTLFAYRGVTLAPNGKIYMPPCNTSTDTYLRYDPATNTWDKFATPPISGTGMFNSACIGSDGKIYCPPHTFDKVLVIDPETETSELRDWGISWSGTTYSYLSCMSLGDKLFFMGGGANDCVVIDLIADTATRSNYGLTSFWSGSTNKVISTTLSLADGKIYGIPYDPPTAARTVFVYDPETNTAELDNFGATWYRQGSQGSGNSPSGDIAVAGHNTSTIYRTFDPISRTLTDSDSGIKAYGATMATDGNLYSFYGSSGTGRGTVYDTHTNVNDTNPTYMPSTFAAFSGGIMDLDGNLVVMPRAATDNVFIIDTKGSGVSSPYYEEIILSPYFNKGK